jgi:branched-chain amino acid transport system permease protein
MILLGWGSFKVFPRVQKIVELSGMKQLLFMLGFSYFLQNIVLVVVGSKNYTLTSVVTKFDTIAWDIYFSSTRFIAGVVSVAFMLILMYVINKTDLGRAIQASAQDTNAAAMMGINPNKTRMIAWIIGVGSLGIAAPMLSSIYTFHPLVATFWQMMAFMSVVLGGLGNIFAALVGGVIMSVALEMGNVFLPGSLAPAVPFMIFVVVLLIRPEGLFGEASRGTR